MSPSQTPLHDLPQRGFTLVELMVSIAVLAVVMSFAAPAFTRMLATNRIANQTNEFSSALKVARSEAIRRGQPIAVRALSSTTPGDFARAGWSVFTDQNADGSPGAPVTAEDGTVLKENDAASGNVGVVRVDRSGSAGSYTYAATSLNATQRRFVVFSSRGVNASSNDAFFRVCDAGATGVSGRIIRVSAVGTVTLAETNVACS